MNQTTKRILFTALTIVILVSACTPAPAPTQDPALVQEQINQAVELTIDAQNALATEQQAAIIPTNTPLPTQTEAAPPTPTLTVPTATAFVIVPATNTVAPVVSGGGGGGNVPVAPSPYACTVTNRKPADNTIFKPGEDFDIKWTITNTGTKTIRAGTDIKYSSGTQMTTVTFVELPELAPGASTTVIIDAEAPNKLGNYVMTWVVEGQLCFAYVAITVAK
jgi:hypothetical protein